MKSSIGAIILQLLGGIIPFAIFHWGFGIAIWLSIALAVLVVGIFMLPGRDTSGRRILSRRVRLTTHRTLDGRETVSCMVNVAVLGSHHGET